MSDSMQTFVKWLWKQLCSSCGIFWCPATSWTVGCQIAHALITPVFSCPQLVWASWRCCMGQKQRNPTFTLWLSCCAIFCQTLLFFVIESTLTILSHILSFHPSIFPSPTFSWPTFDLLFLPWLEVNPQREHRVSLAPCQFPHKMHPSSLYIFPVSPPYARFSSILIPESSCVWRLGFRYLYLKETHFGTGLLYCRTFLTHIFTPATYMYHPFKNLALN